MAFQADSRLLEGAYANMPPRAKSPPPTRIRTRPKPIASFYCEPLSCWISKTSCAARFTFAERGDKHHEGGPCGKRCNVGTAVHAGDPLPAGFQVVVQEAVETIPSRDKAWGHAECQQCGTRYKRNSGNHRNFCRRRCAKRFYRPYNPPAPGLEALEAVLEGY